MVFQGKRKNNCEWVEGYLLQSNLIVPSGQFINFCKCNDRNIITSDSSFEFYEIIPETLREYTGLTDKNSFKVFEGDIVRIADFQYGEVVKECGAFGIAVLPYIDWNYLEKKIAEITGCNNQPCFCYNDNFISLWELMWNYNQEENHCDILEIIGNIHDNPELLEVK